MDNKKNFAWPVTTVCKYDLKAFEKFIEEKAYFLNGKKIIVFGAGIRGTQYSHFLKRFGYKDIVFTDNNITKIGGYINEFPIVSLNEALAEKEKNVILVSLENGESICNQLRELGLKEGRDFFYIDNHLYDEYEKKFMDREKKDTLLMGDCGITDLSIKDINRANLGDMLSERAGKNAVKVLAIHAMGMRAYYTIFKAHCEYVYKPKNIVLMVNMEVFTGKQHLLPRSQHAALIERISNDVQNKDPELLEYVKITKERFLNFENDYFTSSDNALKNMGQGTNEKIVIKMNYMFRMDTENECIVYLKNFIQYCQENNIKLLLFIPPANYEFAQTLWGDSFQEKYDKNVKVLLDIAREKNVPIKDFSYRLPSDKFADVCTIDETLNQDGRRIISEELIGKMKEEGML